MALDFTGIENVEFYSEHYLSAVLEGDLKTVFNKWKKQKEEDGKRQPHELLNGLANRYFTAYGKAAGEPDAAERLRLAQDFHAYLIEALGYQRAPDVEPLDGDGVCPVHLALRRDGNPFLWVVDAPFAEADDDDPLLEAPLPEQLPEGVDPDDLPRAENGQRATWRELFDERLFRMDHAPRWVLFLAGGEALLIERHKWPQGRYLRFDLGELFGRRQATALRAMAGLLHKDALAPDAGICLHDTLDENSHKHAYAVSADLKHGVRRAVELLANEAVWYRREVQKQAVFSEEELAPKLTTECLAWLYRLLFLFYVEARGGELGVVPMKADAYRKGYSLESLRDLELVGLTTEHARNGYYLHDSLQRLFRIVNLGFPTIAPGEVQAEILLLTESEMQVEALNSPLFDDERLDVLKNVRFRNYVLQDVLQLLSLSAEKKRKTRGRISYAQLGVNQLGAVYEGILAYTGFFATEDLYEVASEKECKQLSGKPAAEREALKTYFVPATRIGDFKEGEIVKDENGKKVVHKKGSFIFRLSGRNREKSASYYTPEVLTKCLVKYALKELLWEEGEGVEKPRRKKTADEILALTICEPAMGSSAFLIEAVDQLADAYLEARQDELGETIPPEDYQREKRRVKARLATNNCYGVDLNPTAVELAKVSLWLATLYEGGKCPWFGLRLATGNSLVGARREVFKTSDVTRPNKKDDPNWLGLVPESVPLCHGPEGPPLDEQWTPPPRPKGTIYHFLLPGAGMAAFDKDKVIKELAREPVKHIKEWRKEFCKPFSKQDAKRLETISDAVDRLFAQVVRERVLATQETSDRIPVWGESPAAGDAGLLMRDQEEVAAALEHRSSAYYRLKLAMDSWCALWFWPIREANLLPDRATWLAQLELILVGQVARQPVYQQEELFASLAPAAQEELPLWEHLPAEYAPAREAAGERLRRLRALSDAFHERRANYMEECGLADIDAVLQGDASLRVVQHIAAGLTFHHWPLRFAEIFARRGGFDLVLGNPPWIKTQWEESGILSDYYPILVIRKLSATRISTTRSDLLRDLTTRNAYFAEFVELQGSQDYFNAVTNYPFLRGLQTNSYKCFIVRAWGILRSGGVSSFLHPEGVYDDAKGGALRRTLYPRLRAHYQFANELKLFPEIGNRNRFSLNFYGDDRGAAAFVHMSHLLHPQTIDLSWKHDALGPVPLIKSSLGDWDLSGHRSRLIFVDSRRLALFAALYDDPRTEPLEARLPLLHSEQIVGVLEKFASAPRKLGDLQGDIFSTEMWHESDRQKDGTIRRETTYPACITNLVFQAPHFYVAQPLYQTPKEICDSHRAYIPIDIPTTNDDYLPRTNYLPSSNAELLKGRTPRWGEKEISSLYRHANRRRTGPSGERTLIPCLLPPGPAHVDSVFSIAFSDYGSLVTFNGLCCSVPYDFFVKTAGKGDCRGDMMRQMPVVEPPLPWELISRTLLLNCVLLPYADLWHHFFEKGRRGLRFTKVERRLRHLSSIPAAWSRKFALQSDYERRQALIEIDVLASMALGLRTGDLTSIYRIQFPVLWQNEANQVFDQNGRTVPSSRSAGGVQAVSLMELGATLREETGFDIHAEYYPNGLNTKALREKKVRLGKREAEVLGVPERCTMAELLKETEVRWSDDEHPEGCPVRLVGLRYTDPGLEPRMERVYPTPWTRCDREADYRQAWAAFERRLGKKMPEGTPL